MTALLKMQGARAAAAKKWPYLSSGLYAMIWKETTSVNIMAVDRWWRIYYNPVAVVDLEPEHLCSIMMHELKHLIGKHSQRSDAFAGLDGELSNMAMDAEINHSLTRDGFPLPEGHITASVFGCKEEGKLWEYYYRWLLDHKITPPKPPDGGGNPDDEETDGETNGGSPDTEADSPPDSEDGGGSESATFADDEGEQHTTEPQTNPSGSCADGQQKDWEDGSPEESGEHGVSTGRSDNLLVKIAQDIVDHNQQNPGSVPGNMLHDAETTLASKADWRRELAAVMRKTAQHVAGNTDYTFLRRSRRQAAFKDFIFPGTHSPSPEIAVFVDTSGSMIGLAPRVMGEVKGILDTVKRGVRFFTVDIDPSETKVVTRTENLDLKGGGGTDMGNGMAYAADLNPACDIAVCVTDGYTPWPEEAPPYEFIVCLIDDNRVEEGWPVPEYAQVVRVPKGEI